MPAQLHTLGAAGASAICSSLRVNSGDHIKDSLLSGRAADQLRGFERQTAAPAYVNRPDQRHSGIASRYRWRGLADASVIARVMSGQACSLSPQLQSGGIASALEAMRSQSQPSMQHVSTDGGTSTHCRALHRAHEQLRSASAVNCGPAALSSAKQRRGYAVSTKGHQPSAALREIGNQQLRSFVESPGMLAEPYTCALVFASCLTSSRRVLKAAVMCVLANMRLAGAFDACTLLTIMLATAGAEPRRCHSCGHG